MPIIEILPMNVNEESNDAPKKFTNIDKEDFVFTWRGEKDSHTYTVKTGETQTFPKYLVNFACTHLARKIVKRELRKKFIEEHPTENYKNADFATRNEEMEKKLHIKMVWENLPEEKKQELQAVKEGEIDKPKEEFKCDVCGFVAKSKFGLATHKRFKHK